MNDKTLNKINGRNSFNNEFVILMSVVMKGDVGARIGVDPGSGNDGSAEIATDVFRYNGRITVIRLGVNVEAFAMVLINGSFDFLKGGTEFIMETIKQSGTEGIA